LCLGGWVWGQHQPFVVHETKPVIMSGPWLVAPTETSTTVVWITDTPCHSKVVYGTDGALSQEAEAPVHGLLPVGQRHVIRIAGLKPGRTYQYKVVSTRVVKMKSYWPEKGLSTESPVYSFTTLDRGKPSFSFSAITDTHEDVARINALTKMVDWNTTDFLVHLGDAFHGVESEEALLTKWLDPLSRVLAHTKPLLYARGNHEARGAAARAVMDYYPIEEGRFYYARDHGPVHLLVLDTGEDKPDETNVYSGLNRFKAYREEELAWFENHAATDRRFTEAPFRIVLMHAPNWGWAGGNNAKWAEVANKYGVDLTISGHTHRFSHTRAGERGNNYDQLVIGPENLARVDSTAAGLKIQVTTRDGAAVTSFSLPARRPRQQQVAGGVGRR
jgi:predicted phosphodiesterase